MPRIDELPMPAQNEIRAKRGESVQEEHPVGQRMSLLQRIASVAVLAAVRTMRKPRSRRGRPACRNRRSVSPVVRRHGHLSRGRRPVSEYAKRPAPQGLDQHGRQAPVHNSSEEDQLDIPAFLRRQAN